MVGNVEFSASMMCANYGNLENEIKMLEEAGISSFHIDIMDGQYVPNFGMGLQDLEYIKKIATKPVEVHLMIKEPSRYLDIFIERKVDVIYFHPESDYHPTIIIEKLRKAGIEPGIVINPGTSVESVRELLYIVNKVMVMGVNPGNAGQVYLSYAGRKIEDLLKMKSQYNYEVYWDGSCGIDKIVTYAPMGVKGFVLGTKMLFGHKESYAERLNIARNSINGHMESDKK